MLEVKETEKKTLKFPEIENPTKKSGVKECHGVCHRNRKVTKTHLWLKHTRGGSRINDDQYFKAILGYIISSRQAWAT